MQIEGRHRAAEQRSSGKRPDIQGLRAIAAMLVVLFHLWPAWLGGGYVGVDIFFVISGFLITSHLLREVESSGTVGLREFWARRARRLLPAAYVVLATTAVAVRIWVPELHWKQFFREIVASTLYVENWALANDAVDYLAQENAASPVQHYWTLSVEEQFYIVWPLLVLLGIALAARLRLRRRLAIGSVLAVAFGASLAYSLYLTDADPARAYFVTTTRAWEFAAGALLAFVPAASLVRLGPTVRTLLAWVSLVVLVGSAFVFDASTPMPGTAAIVVVAAAAGFLAAGGPQTAWSPVRLLDTRPVQFTGDISYALYLWHWPLIILLPYARGQENGPVTLVGILVLTFVLAALSTFYVEDPVRRATRWRIRQPVVTLVVTVLGAALLVVPSVRVWIATDRAEARDLAVAKDLANDTPECFGAASHDPERPCHNPDLDDVRTPDPRFARDDYAPDVKCSSWPVDAPIEPCSYGPWDDPDVPKVAIIGDSHARMMSVPLAALAEDGEIAVDGYFQSGCAWTDAPPRHTTFGPECEAFKKKVATVLDESADRYDVVVTTAFVAKLDGPAEEEADALRRAWAPLLDRGIPVVSIVDIPHNDGHVNECLEEHPTSETTACAIDRVAGTAAVDPLGLAGRRGPGTHAIDLTPYHCDGDTCPAVIGGVTVYADSNHFTATFSRTLAPMLLRELQQTGVLDR